MSKTLGYKWLPEQPTNEMLDAVFALEEPNTLREYEAMWQAAPEVEPYAYATLWENGEWSVVQDIEPNAVKQVPLYAPQPK